MTKEQKITDFYVLCNKLKYVIRTGWKDWHVKKERLESVAEHIYGTQMLAIAMYSEFEEYKSLNLYRIILMLAVHELGEIDIGDLTQFQISKEEKEKKEHAAVHKILSPLLSSEQIEGLFLEFDSHDTPEAMFAYQCDKLECDLQCKLYDEDGCVDLNDQEGNTTMDYPMVRELLDEGLSWSGMWLEFGQRKYPYDDNFRSVSTYAKSHDLKRG